MRLLYTVKSVTYPPLRYSLVIRQPTHVEASDLQEAKQQIAAECGVSPDDVEIGTGCLLLDRDEQSR